MGNVISASNLCFMDFIVYPEIQIEENRMTFICGESGCGKSTLLKLFNATLSPSDGTILFHGKTIEELNTIEYRRKVLLVSQEAYLFDGTIRDNFNAYYASRDAAPIDDTAILKSLACCCADFPLDAQCSVLSGGERQRVFLAVCLSLSPEVLMLDEPTSALDGKTSGNLFANIREFCTLRGMTVIVVCHDKVLVDTFADRIIELTKGERQ